MKKYLYRWLYPIARIYWNIFQPVTFGVRVILINQNQVLLVRHTYLPGDKWMLPGGGVSRGESYDQAIKREIKEELDISLKKVNWLGIFTSNLEGKRDNIILFSCLDQIDPDKIIIDPAEIKETKFFPLDQLPDDIALSHRQRILDYVKNKYPYSGQW